MAMRPVAGGGYKAAGGGYKTAGGGSGHEAAGGDGLITAAGGNFSKKILLFFREFWAIWRAPALYIAPALGRAGGPIGRALWEIG